MRKIKVISVWYYDDSVRNAVIDKIYRFINIKFEDWCEYNPQTKQVCFPRNASPDDVWHEIGHAVFDRLPKACKHAFGKCVLDDVTNIIKSTSFQNVQTSTRLGISHYDFNDACRILGDFNLVTPGNGHRDGYGADNPARCAASETFAEMFSAFMRHKTFGKAPKSKKFFKEIIGEIIQ